MTDCNNCFHRKACKMFAKKFFNMPLRRVISGCENYKPAADVEKVVRCPECIYCENMKCKELRDDTGHPLDVAVFDYCSQGVRKERKDN